MFKVNQSGFSIKFANGVTASVQFGKNNYCQNQNTKDEQPSSSPDAEMIAWDDSGEFITEALGWRNADEVASFLKEMSEK